MLSWLYDLFASIFGLVEAFIFIAFLLSVLTFAVPAILQSYVNKEQNLREKYNAKWAVVTGGSSGIGRAITEKLAQQGINVVIVALDEPILHDLHDILKKQYPELQFRAVGVDLSGHDYMKSIVEATEDIDVNLLFNNAGFITIGFFADTNIERQMKNYNVNATCAVRITHHFLRKMIQKQLKGAISFTSSPAGLFPCPFSVIYGSTKAFLTEFATSLACEVKADGIDVFVLHPSPVDTNFYNSETAHKSSSLGFFRKTASPPTEIADTIFKNIGNWTVVRDQGYFSVSLKMLLKVIDYNLLSLVLSVFTPLATEYQKLLKERNEKGMQ
jgi:short-subunit dehydrogenase